MAKIFIAYAHEQQLFAMQLARSLSNIGADVWIDVESIPPGMKWHNAIHEGLQTCEILLLIITPESMQSHNVEAEWFQFLQDKKPIIPILYRQAGIHYLLRPLDWIDFENNDFANAFHELHSELLRRRFEVKNLPDYDEWFPDTSQTQLPLRKQDRNFFTRNISSPSMKELVIAILAAVIGGILLMWISEAGQIDTLPDSFQNPAIAQNSSKTPEFQQPVATETKFEVELTLTEEYTLSANATIAVEQFSADETMTHESLITLSSATLSSPTLSSTPEPLKTYTLTATSTSEPTQSDILTSSPTTTSTATPIIPPDTDIFQFVTTDINNISVKDIVELTQLNVWSSSTIYSLSFSPDDTQLAVGTGQPGYGGTYERPIYIWSLLSQKIVNTLTEHTGEVFSVAFSSDGSRLVSASNDRTIRAWSMETGEQIESFSGHEGTVYSAKFLSGNSRIISGSQDYLLMFWDINMRSQERYLYELDSIFDVEVSPDGSLLVSALENNTISFRNINDLAIEAVLEGHTAPIADIAFSPDSSLLASISNEGNIRLWDTTTYEELAILGNPSASSNSTLFWRHRYLYSLLENSVIFSPDSSLLASISNEGNIRLWDTTTYKELVVIENNYKPAYSLAFSNNGMLLVFSSGNTIHFWGVPP